MPRTSRVIIAGVPHHVIQRGNRKHIVFLMILIECIIYAFLEKMP